MKSKHDAPRPRPILTLPAAGLLALAIAAIGPAREGSLARADVEPQDAGRRAVGARITYEVQWLEGVDAAGCDFDSVATGGGKPVRLGFVSELEQQMLADSARHWPSGRHLRAPKRTAPAGQKVRVRMPREAGRPPGDGAATSVEVSGTLNDRHVQLSIRLTRVTPGARRRGREEVEVRDVECGLPDGGTVMLSMDAPAGGRERLVLVTPRIGVAGKDAGPMGRP